MEDTDPNDPSQYTEEEDPEEVEERRRAAEMEVARLEAEAVAAREAERKARKRQTIGMLEAASDDPFFSSLIQEEDQITDDIQDTVKNGGRLFEHQLISPTEYKRSLQTGRLQYLKMCAELNYPPCSKWLRSLGDRVVNMSHYGLGPDGAMAIADCLTVNAAIFSLNLDDNSIGEVGALALAGALEHNTSIASLDLSNNGIPPRAIARLMQPVFANKSLQEISLRQNKVTDEVLELFCEVISKGLRLTKLDLSQNDITEKGMVPLAALLEGNHSLVELNLSWNQLRETGGKLLAQSLASNSGSRYLKRLHVAFAGLGPQAGQIWAAVIGRGGQDSLEYLDLSNNRFDAHVGEIMAQSISENENLHHLDISANPFGGTTEKVLAALQENKTLVSYRLSTPSGLVEEDRSVNRKHLIHGAAKNRSSFY